MGWEPTIGGNGQLHNYCIVFVISSFAAFLAFVWALLMIDEQSDMVMFVDKLGNDNDRVAVDKNLKEWMIEADTHPLRLLFDWNNIRQMLTTYVKRRPNKLRMQILLITLALFCNWFVLFGPITFQFQFTEIVYKWNVTTYNYVNSIGKVTTSIAMMVISPILIKVVCHSL